MENKRALWRSLLPPVIMLAVIFTVWELIVRFELVYSWLIPSPLGVLKEMAIGWERLLEHWLATMQLTVLGFLGGAVCGILLGMVLHFVPLVRQAMYPVLILSQNIPVIVIAPILTMLLGFGLLPKVLLIILVCFFPICIAMLGGLAQVDQGLRNYMGMIGSSRWQQFVHLELPSSLGSLFSGLKIAASYSVLSAVVAEWLSPKVGLGGYMILSSRGYMPERVFAAVLLIVLTSLLLFWLVSLVERLLVRWRPRKEAR
ncbi:nitrate ABC transporter permease [Paenibacillus montaniterrae]|uniref:Nitrate ABC transporter permease n=1 Tax=Paenibacillus montaniterrae TaxID=429341 RepID=A0A920CS67_9BACL|nr:ABC transporter permease [Paenibacillus montaniterrae]GIP14497.1 nitrate ABC transporter permease [Paenibacillus montaniterrae]